MTDIFGDNTTNLSSEVEKAKLDWKEYRFGKLWTLETIPKKPVPIEWYLDMIIPKRSLNMFYGLPGHAKSLVVMDMCMCIASGKNWLSNPHFKSTRTKILWLDVDQGSDVMNERLFALHAAHGDQNTQFYYYSFPLKGLNLTKDDHVEDTIKLIEELEVSIVVFDTFKRIAGDVSENSSDIDLVLGALRRIISDTGCTIIVIHHANKNDADGQARIRGSTAIAGGIDNGYHVEYIKDITEPARFKITHEKFRRTAPVHPIEFRINSTDNNEGATVKMYCEPYHKEDKWRKLSTGRSDDEPSDEDWRM